MLRVEFHCHTCYSEDALTTASQLLATCARKGIDRVVITDHNTIAGALQVQQLDPERVIVGEEILTTQGELLAAFVQEEVPAGLTPLEAIARLRDQGAFISVSHPFDVFRKGHWRLEHLEAIAPLVDALEVFNSRCVRSTFNIQAQRFAQAWGLLGTVGSDAHIPYEVGRATLLLPHFSNSESLKASLNMAKAMTKLSPPWVHFASRWAVWLRNRGSH